jgi:radical SAM superfamily enzyme YgiQ (UPF0313 family)
MRKSRDELREICSAGLNLLYCGMESGADSVLKMVNKGVTAKEPITAGIRSFKHIRVVFEPITPGMV